MVGNLFVRCSVALFTRASERIKSKSMLSYELLSPTKEYRTFYEHRADSYAPDLRIGRKKSTSTKDKLLRERYPQRDSSAHQIFTNLHHNCGSLVTRTPSMEQNVLNTVLRNPSTSVRAVVAVIGGSLVVL
ncbi:hypothetical protein TNCV_2412921 [Trichonephila clavipes]|nr:hypothetical protein TNCV_2412921 [Trichonephila clavipes]